MEIVLPGEADPTVHLDGAARRAGVHVAETRLGDARGTGVLARAMIERVRRVPHERPRGLDLRHHLRRHVLERLERADLPAELLARLRILDRHRERPLGATEAVGGDADRTEVEQALEEPPALAFAAEQRRRRQRDVAQGELADAAREVDGLLGADAHAGRLARDEEERYARRAA